jgi:hypothetical protein
LGAFFVFRSHSSELDSVKNQFKTVSRITP